MIGPEQARSLQRLFEAIDQEFHVWHLAWETRTAIRQGGSLMVEIPNSPIQVFDASQFIDKIPLLNWFGFIHALQEPGARIAIIDSNNQSIASLE